MDDGLEFGSVCRKDSETMSFLFLCYDYNLIWKGAWTERACFGIYYHKGRAFCIMGDDKRS